MMFFRLRRIIDEEPVQLMDKDTLIALANTIKLPLRVKRVSLRSGLNDYGDPCLVVANGNKVFFQGEETPLDPDDDAWRILSVEYPRVEQPASLLATATKELPTKPGFYWAWGVRTTMQYKRTLPLRVYQFGYDNISGNLVVLETVSGIAKGLPVLMMKGMFFAGPITPPELPYDA